MHPWEKYYKTTPYRKIPWRRISTNFLKMAIEKYCLSGKALDLGCGTGEKTIFLSKNGFETEGVDISKTVITSASKKGKREGSKAKFYIGDVKNLAFLKEPYDLIVDYGCFHSISPKDRKHYFKELNRLTKFKSYLILMCHSKERTPKIEKARLSDVSGIQRYYFSEKDIKRYFSKFKIIEKQNIAFTVPTKAFTKKRYLDFYLMQKF